MNPEPIAYLGSQCEAVCKVFEAAWQRGETPRIEDYLGSVGAELLPILLKRLLLLETTYRRQAGHTPRRDEYAERFCEFASLLDTVFPTEPSTVPPSDEADPDATCHFTECESASSQVDATDCGRFRIIKTHARGGLGEVFLAQDGELHRNVALKRIRERFVDDADSRARFLREAEITGNLEHPGIVPIYGLGTDEAGRPYYAMRFIQGESLQEVIQRFHDPQRTFDDAGRRQLEFRKLLQRFIDVCNAMEYAHSCGVIHRDLKPSNIMVGKYGETLVVDWGLAKVMMATRDAETETPDAIDEALLDVSTAGDVVPTQMGQAVGTPQYMSPEQAAGNLDELTVATDVYALGAVLYSLLCGQPPIAGNSLGEILQHVKQGKVKPLTASAPRPLASICRKAMSVEPNARYASALALANDVEKWLADERVAAHRELFVERTTRWARTHRTLVTGAAALTVTSVVALVIGLVVVSAEKRETEQHRRTAEAKQREAETSQARETKERKRAEEQRLLAEANQRGAEAAQVREAEERKRADEQRLLAEARKKDADNQRDHAEWTSYLAHIQAADAEWDRNRVGSAILQLDACPPNLRGWEHDYLFAKFHRGHMPLRGHTATVKSVAFSPDGKQIASSSVDQTVKLWDAVTGEETLTLRGHTAAVQSVAFSPDGKQIVSGSSDWIVKVWDVTNGKETLALRGHTSPVTSVVFSPDGKQIASGSSDGTVNLWDTVTGEETRSHMQFSSIWSVAFSPDGERIVSGSDGGIVRVWDVATGEETRMLRGNVYPVSSVAFSPDGKRIISGSLDGTVSVWDAANGKEMRTLYGHTAPVRSVAFSPDSKRIVSGSYDWIVKVWDIATGEETRTLRGHTSPVYSVAFSPDGNRIVSGGEDGKVRLWDSATDYEMWTLRHTASVSSVAFSPDGKRIISGGLDGTVSVWDAAKGQVIRTLRRQTAPVKSVAFSPDGKWIASSGEDWVVRLWDAATGEETLTLRGHRASVTSVAFSPDGKRIVSGSSDGTARLWDTANGKMIVEFRGIAKFVTSVVFSPDGKRIIGGSDHGTVWVWEVATSKAKRALSLGHTASVMSVAFSPDGKRIVSGNLDGRVSVWDAVTGVETLTLRGHTAAVWSVAFSPDGKRIVSGSRDQTVKLWDAVIGEETLTLRGHTAAVWSVAFSPDGKRIVSGSSDVTVRVWDATPPVSIRSPSINTAARK